MARIVVAYVSLLLVLTACRSEKNVNGTGADRQPATPRITTLAAPERGLSLALGADIPVRLEIPDSVRVDSVRFFLDGDPVHTLVAGPGFPASGPVEALLPTGGLTTGRKAVRLRVHFEGGVAENQSSRVTLLSDITPREYSYSVVNEFPHDASAYTQGLQYADGWLYEGTGNYGTSSLRRVELATGEVDRIRNLDPSLFGEGITVIGNRIYQLTYKAQVGFIYDRSTFEEIQRVYYQNREGWGLTYDGEELIMSDGTHILYFLDPELFTVNRQLEVYTDKGPAERLNELEYIRGKIWANRYYTDEIVIIDPASGRVEGRVNLKGLLKPADRTPGTDVLNGIAWDEEGDRLFVTGKLWPKLFEIRVRPLGSGG